MVKRKAKDLGDGESAPLPRRSSRQVSTVATADGQKKKEMKDEEIKGEEIQEEEIKKEEIREKPKRPAKKAAATSKPTAPNQYSTRQYWLMKAEPESRLEKGQDIKFSIDDLAAKSEPEPWDGIRAYPARNNLRGMKKGDLSFFYHSSCKVPAIVGIMEVVQEHSPDLSAHDSSAPYYDPSSSPENPKWSVVHVSFRQKLQTPVTLKDLRALQAEKDSPLANMQMLKLTRLSVSKVAPEEWDFLIEVMKKNGEDILSS